VGLYTAEDNFASLLDADYTLHTSFPYTIITDEEGEISDVELEEIDPVVYMLNRGNPGFALDLGLIYHYDEQITLSASVLDLGFLRWRTDLYNIHATGDYALESIELDEEAFSPDILIDVLNDMLDSLDYSISQDPWTLMLPTQIFLAASYQYNDQLSFGLVNRNVIYRSKLHSSFTLSAQADLAERFMATLSWSYLNNSLKNVGAGVAYVGKGFQFHLVTDNLLGFFAPVYTDFYPFNTRTINLRTGFNLMLGCGKRNRERQQGSSYGRSPRGGDCSWTGKSANREKLMKKASRKQNRN
jgi:hypothetical protein